MTQSLQRTALIGLLAFLVIFLPLNVEAQAQKSDKAKQGAIANTLDRSQIHPFGANLFIGSFQGQHQDGRNANYKIMPGDRVVVNTWGALEVNRIFVVDGQGNIFLPSIGPIPLSGVKNSQLTRVVKGRIARVYKTGVGVYTNLLTAAPVGVYVTGGVPRPGRYAGVPADSALFFLNQAGGIDASTGSYRNIEVLRDNKSIATIDLYDFVLKGTLPPIQFVDGDTLLVKRRGATVLVQGKVSTPSYIEFIPGQMKGSDALAVVPKSARSTAVTVRGVNNGKSYNTSMSMSAFSKRELHDGDIIFLRIEERTDTILIHLEGEFEGPSLLSVKRGSRLLDVLNYVKVDKDLALPHAVHLRRQSVATAQKHSIETSLHRLERSAMLALSSTEKEAAIRVKEAELMQGFIKHARTIQPLGRVVTASYGRQQNVLLNDGDTIVIPTKTNVVRVGGEVRMTQALVYTPGMTAGDYIARSGGFTKRADNDAVIILHASAEVTIGDEDSNVLPGDDLLVAPEVDSKLLQNAADVTQVLYQIAVAAAVVIAL